MKYVNLGAAGAKVARLALGTMNFGPDTPEDEAHQILDRATELGINLIDTANVYGWHPQQGWTEEIIGRWFEKRPGVRDSVVLATKLYEPMGVGPNERGLSALHIRTQVEASLKRLQTDHIDLYQFHHVDREVRWEEIWQAIEVLVQQGKIVYSGSSNFPGWVIAAANERAASRNLLGLVTEQSVFSLMKRDLELEVLPAARAYGMGVLAWSPLAGGNLSGAAKRAGNRQPRATQSARDVGAVFDRERPQIERYEAFAEERGHSPAQLALAWLLHQPGVLGPVVGPRTVAQLDGSVGALDIRLDDSDLAELDRIWPGPGPAPEAYAW